MGATKWDRVTQHKVGSHLPWLPAFLREQPLPSCGLYGDLLFPPLLPSLPLSLLSSPLEKALLSDKKPLNR